MAIQTTTYDIMQALVLLLTAAWTAYQEYRHRKNNKGGNQTITAMQLGTAPNGSTDLQVVQK